MTLKESNTKISDLEEQLSESNTRFKEFEGKINLVTDAERIISAKEKEIENLKGELEEKINNINELNDKLQSLETELSDEDKFPSLCAKIQKLAELKGFITDKDIEDLFKEF